MTFPLSALLTYSLRSPVISTLSAEKIALMDALPDDKYWQSLHQHARVAIGGRLHWNRTAPQKQRPVMGIGILASLAGDLPGYQPVALRYKMDDEAACDHSAGRGCSVALPRGANAGTMSTNTKPSRSTISPPVTAIGAENIGHDETNV